MAHTIGQRIREARKAYGMTQVTLARRIGISKQALYQIENGKTPDPGVLKIMAIAKVLGVSMNDLTNVED
jgi:transcriptional regulator with XRE-family HTH domain